LRNHDVTAILRKPEKLGEKHKHLRVIKGDVTNSVELTSLFKDNNIVISAYNAGWTNPNLYQDFIKGSAAIQQACKAAGIRRYLVVGGAGSLEIEPGKQLVDSPDFPLHISVEETAVALLDEAEQPRFHQQRFTIAW
jgi:hypothetical protein